MTYKLFDLVNFIGNVNLISENGKRYDAYDYMNTYGSHIKVECLHVKRDCNGFAIVIIKRV